MSHASMKARSSSSMRFRTMRSSIRSASRRVSKRSCNRRLASWYIVRPEPARRRGASRTWSRRPRRRRGPCRLRRIRKLERDPAVGEPRAQPGELQLDDLRELLARELMELDDLVDAIQELG